MLNIPNKLKLGKFFDLFLKIYRDVNIGFVERERYVNADIYYSIFNIIEKSCLHISCCISQYVYVNLIVKTICHFVIYYNILIAFLRN